MRLALFGGLNHLQLGQLLAFKPGSIKKKPGIAVHEDSKDDEAWLDDLLDE